MEPWLATWEKCSSGENSAAQMQNSLVLGTVAVILKHCDLVTAGDAIWRHGNRATLAQVMACCLTAPSHYLNQCWLIIIVVPWHSSEGIIIRRCEDTNGQSKIENCSVKMASKSPRGQWVKWVIFKLISRMPSDESHKIITEVNIGLDNALACCCQTSWSNVDQVLCRYMASLNYGFTKDNV